MGAPGKRRPAIVALSQPKASAPRLHQSNRSHQPTRAPKPTSDWERADGEGSAHAECPGRRVRAERHGDGNLFATPGGTGRARRVPHDKTP